MIGIQLNHFSNCEIAVRRETALSEKKVHLQKNRKKWPRTDVETATIVNFFQLSRFFEEDRLLELQSKFN